ncbi:WxL protein peptidoglycan domain-containing protein [Actinoplanes solisilvae]|uniref:WxL protein peptidoglycan domain-containing protein n=1 Tax=Actinoplanes solisilvae TaxID=2486853 RepID=UPI000FDCB7D8|nr:DUF916 domain-containing protein [Actinoplanes solisilvae]
MRTPIAAVLAVAAILGFGAQPALASDEVTWTVRTASNSFGADRSSYSYNVNPGGSLKDALVVANRGKKPVKLAVYASDGFTTGTGQLDLRGHADKQTGVGAWVTSAQKSLTVDAGKTITIPFTVTLPGNATPGDHVGGIITSLTAPDATETVNVERRLGIRIKMRVGGDLAPALAIEKPHLSYEGGRATLDYTLHNTGNATQSADQAAKVSGPFGWFSSTAGTIAAPPELLPGETWKVSVPLSDVTPAFWLTGKVTVTPRLTDASGSTTSLKPVTATAHAWAVPWLVAALVLLLIAAIVLGVILYRRARVRRKEREDARVRDAVAEALDAAARP